MPVRAGEAVKGRPLVVVQREMRACARRPTLVNSHVLEGASKVPASPRAGAIGPSRLLNCAQSLLCRLPEEEESGRRGRGARTRRRLVHTRHSPRHC